LLVLGKDCVDILEILLQTRPHLAWMYSITQQDYSNATEQLYAHAKFFSAPPTVWKKSAKSLDEDIAVRGTRIVIPATVPSAPSSSSSIKSIQKGSLGQCNTLFSLAKLTSKLADKLAAQESSSPVVSVATVQSVPSNAKQVDADIHRQLTLIRIQQSVLPAIGEDSDAPHSDSELLQKIFHYLKRYLSPLQERLATISAPMETKSIVQNIERAFPKGLMFRLVSSAFALLDMMISYRKIIGGPGLEKELNYLENEAGSKLWEYVLVYDLVDWCLLADESSALSYALTLPSSSSIASSLASTSVWTDDMVFPRLLEILSEEAVAGKLEHPNALILSIYSPDRFLQLLDTSNVLSVAYDSTVECISHVGENQDGVNMRMEQLLTHCVLFIKQKFPSLL